jgi:O-antigen ligase
MILKTNSETSKIKVGNGVISVLNKDMVVAEFPKIIYSLFYFFSAYLVFPVINVPFLGLSLSAPIFFFIAVTCIFKPPRPWFKGYQVWIFLAIFYWLGIFISTAANGILSFGVSIDSGGIKALVQYVYWLIVFVITTYFASQGLVLEKLAKVLGWSVMVLGLMRLLEVILYGSVYGSSSPHFLTQNSYGVLFSMFSPFLLLLMIGKRKKQSLFALGGYFLLLAAVAINGSRGSWISIAVGLGIGLLILIISKPRKSIGLLLWLSVAFVGLITVWVAVPQVSTAVEARFNTLETLEEDKNYVFRQVMVQKGLLIFKENPIIGIGPGRFIKTTVALELPRIFSGAGNMPSLTSESAHNSYIVVLAENGLVLAIPFAIILIILLFRGFLSGFKSIRRDDYLPLAVFLSFLQMSIHFWVIASLTNTSTWFVYGLVAAVIMREKKQAIKCA